MSLISGGYKSSGFSETSNWRMFPLLIMVIVVTGLFSSVVDAKSAKSQSRETQERLRESMKAQFDAAITNGDADTARAIWASIDTKFGDNIDSAVARTIIQGASPILRQNELQNLASISTVKLEQVTLFLSSIDRERSFMASSPAATTVHLSGTVRDAGDKRLAGAKVIVGGHETTTGSDGSFAFDGIPVGMYDMFVLAPHHKVFITDKTVKPKNNSPSSFRLTALNAPPPPTPKEAEAQMIAAMTALGKSLKKTKADGQEILAGTLLDAGTGAPIVDATVTLGCEGNDAFKALMAETKSDENGRFEISKIPEGICDLIAAKTNLTFSNYIDKVDSGEARAYLGGQKFKMTVNATHQHEHTWRIEPKTPNASGTVAGVVRNAVDHTPVANARVTVGDRKIGVVSFGGESVDTDVNGRFEIRFVPVGNQTIEATKEIFRPTTQDVNVQAAKSVEVALTLEPITVGTVTGVVLNAANQKPLAGVKVTLGTLSAMTDVQGRFELTNVHAGDATVQGSKAIFKPASQGVQVRAAKSVEVTLTLEPITVGSVTGIALNATTQKPLAGVQVSLGTQSTTTDAQGRFTLADVAAGAASVQGSKAVFKSASKPVQVLAAKNVQVILALEPITVGSVTGIALNATTQKPLAGVQVSLGTRSTTTDAQGRFTLADVAAGAASVQGSKAVFKTASKPVQVLAAKRVEVTLALEPITVGSVTGIALNATTQKPLAGVQVSLGTRSTTTDAQGRFTLADVAAGAASVQGSKAVFKTASKPVQVLAAKRVEVTLALEPITVGSVTGIALNATTQKPLAGVQVNLGTRSTMTDARGRFTLADVAAGAASVQGSKAVFKAASKPVQVLAAKNVQVTLALEPITVGSVTGIALNATTQKPLAGVQVSLGTRSTTTDARGRFTLADVDAGAASVQGSKAIFKTASKPVQVLAAKRVEVTLALEPITVGSVTGIALNATTQKPLAGVQVNLGTRSTMTDARGRFTLADVDAGAASVQGSKAVFKTASKPVQVLAAKRVEVTLALEPITTASISGIVVDKNSQKPIAGARVSAGDLADETNAKGHYSLEPLHTGEIVLVSRHPDYKTDGHTLELEAGHAYEQKVEMQPRREDVKELEAALKLKGTVDLYGIHFNSGKDQFKPSSLSTLQAVSEVIKGSPNKIFEISGHTDSDGSGDYNQDLSERRAKTVISWLVDHGVRPGQLRAKGYGETKPVAPNNTEGGKALNRRVQLRIIR